MLETKIIKVDNLYIRYSVNGNGEDVILLHGFPETLQCWYAVMPELAKKFRVHTFDWPGFGKSEAPNWDYRPNNYSNFLEKLIEIQKINKPSLVATDIGMLPAFLFGLKQPDKLRKIVVMSGQAYLRPNYISWELKMLESKIKGPAELLAHIFPKLGIYLAFYRGFYKKHSIPTEIYNEFMSSALNKSAQDTGINYFRNFPLDLKYFDEHGDKLNVPTLIIWGKYDVFINWKMGEELHKRTKNSKFEIIDKAGHFIHMEKPDVVTSLITNFL
jgi:pimeloyl-ACP methyl ester carboxylesterase